MGERFRLLLRAGAQAKQVETIVLSRAGDAEFRQLESWGPVLRERGEPDGTWSWRDLREEALEVQGCAVECSALMLGRRVQGAVLFWRSSAPARLDGGSLIYVDRLATAPENRGRGGRTARLAGVGSALMNSVRGFSRRTGCRGRVGLHALAESEGFYRKLGMRRLEPKAGDEGFAYFEWPAEGVG